MTFACRRSRAVLFLMLAPLTFGMPSLCAAASPDDIIPSEQRTDAFRHLLSEFHLKPLLSFADLQAHPSESLLIVLGNPDCLSKKDFPRGLRSFVEAGGAVLIATDEETNGEAGELLASLAGVTVTGEKLVCTNPTEAKVYNGSPYCPFVQPLADPMGLSGSNNILGMLATIVGVGNRPALFRAPQSDGENLHVATNAPSRLQVKSNGWWLPNGFHRLAVLPSGCQNEIKLLFLSDIAPLGARRPPRVRQAPTENLLFAVVGTVGKGRVLVLADHSIFINRMLLPGDNGNLEFTANCLHWLRGGVSNPAEALRTLNNPDALTKLAGERNKALFWDDGRIRRDFSVPLAPGPVKPSLDMEPAIVAAINKTIVRLEDEDYFNRTLLDNLDEWAGGRRRLKLYLVYLLTFAAVLLAGYRFLWRSRYRLEPAVLAVPDVINESGAQLSWMDRRRRAMLRSGNVWETAHGLAREYFESAGIVLSGAAPPRVEITQGNWRRRWRLQRRFARWWRLARGDAPVVIAPKALRRWLRELDELKTAVADGTIRLR
jgi:hypothetical protein